MKRKHIVFLSVAIITQLIFLVSLSNGMLNRFFNDTSYRIGKGGDFYQFYQAGFDLLSGKSIYQTDNKNLKVPFCSLYKYPPFLAYTVGAASQLFEPKTTYYIWCFLSVCCFFLMLFFIYFFLFNKRFFTFLPVLCLSLVYTPYYVDLYMGQTNIFMAFFITLMAVGFSKNLKFLQVIAFVLSLSIKLNTIFLSPVYFIKKRYKYLITSLFITILLFVPYFLFFPKDFSFFMRYVFGGSLSYFYQAGNFGVYPLIEEIAGIFTFNPNVIKTSQSCWSGFVILSALFLYSKIIKNKVDELDLISFFLTVFFISFKFIWEHHFVMLIPVLAIEYLRGDKKTIGFLWFLLAMPTLFVFLDVGLAGRYVELQPYLTVSKSILYHSCKIIPLLILFTAIVLRLLGRNINFNKVVVLYLFIIISMSVFLWIKPLSAKDYVAMAKIARKENNIKLADKYFQKAIFKNPEYVYAYLDYSSFLNSVGNKIKAYEYFDKAVKMAPNHPDIKKIIESVNSK